MKIISLQSENIKRLKAISIKPDGEMVVVAGNNNQGKSSVLDSIEYALAGKRSVPSKPVRDGEKKGRIVCDLGDLIVKRTFKSDGKSTLVVETKDGDVKKSPQMLLDSLVGELSFDPLEFVHMDSKDQLALLRRLSGVDFTEANKERERSYQDRALLNREIDTLKVKKDETPTYSDLPDEEIPISELADKMKRGLELRSEYETTKNTYKNTKDTIRDMKKNVQEVEKQLEEMRIILRQVEATQSELESDLAIKKEYLPDIDSIKEQMDSLEVTNDKIRSNKQYNTIYELLEKAITSAENLTEQIKAIDVQKKKAIAEAGLPVSGLTFDEKEVLLDGIPFSQASSAQQTRVSMAMGVALNPDLRVLLIRNGSLLDHDNMGMVAEFAKENDCQVWIERVGDDEKATVVIEDGEVSETPGL